MSRWLIKKFSGLFYRLHCWLEERSYSPNFSPYRVETQNIPGLPRIVHFNGNFVIGGSSQLIVDLVERTGNSYSHTVIVPEVPRPLPYKPLNIHRFSLQHITAMQAYLKKEKPALAHVHYWVRHYDRFRDFSFWYQAVFKICEELSIPVIQNINVPTRPYESGSVIHNIYVSRYVAQEFNGDNPTPHSVIYPGSDMRHFSNDQIEALPRNTIGMMYRLDPDKLNEAGIDVFIQLAKNNPGLHCYIIGDGPLVIPYKRKVKSNGLNSQFSFPGFIGYRDLPGYYKKMSIIIAPVHDESFGQVSPFAMGMGLAVAGYDTGALGEILGSTETLAQTGDVKSLVQIVQGLIDNTERRIQLGKKNQERARKWFSTEEMIKKYEALYQSCLNPVMSP